MPRVNARRQARRRLNYATVIRSDFHKRLRYLAWERSGGFCECVECWRALGNIQAGRPKPGLTIRQLEAIVRAETRIHVWFVNSGRAVWHRFRCDTAEIHHMSYALFGDENPAELALVRFVWKECHQRIEAAHHTRRRFLKGGSR